MDTEEDSLMEETELFIDSSTSSGFKDGCSPNTMDELMSVLDVLEEHTENSIQSNKETEIYWLHALQERDELITSKDQSIQDLQRLNDKLRVENEALHHQLIEINQDSLVKALQDDTVCPPEASLQFQVNLADWQNDEILRLREHNALLAERLDQSKRVFHETIVQLQNERESKGFEISAMCYGIENEQQGITQCQRDTLHSKVENLCQIYDNIIKDTCDRYHRHTEDYNLDQIGTPVSLQESLNETTTSSRLSGNTCTNEHYTNMLTSLEKSNRDLRFELEQLQKDLASKEQGYFNDVMARIDNSNRDQMDKMKKQITDLSRELSLLNVDNRALRERLLKTENDNEGLLKKLCSSKQIDDEMESLQSNLNTQLAMNQSLEKEIKQLNLIKIEHDTLCRQMEGELAETKLKLHSDEEELKTLRNKLKEAKDLQFKFDLSNLKLNQQLNSLQSESNSLKAQLSKVQQEALDSEKAAMYENSKISELKETVKKLAESQQDYEEKTQRLSNQLGASEKQRSNANMKVKSLRERLKQMQDSWNKISSDTESSFNTLKDQYQQQIKEYKSIVESLKSQNTALNARIESMKKVADQISSNQGVQVTGLEQQISDYKNITEGYREENIQLRKELKEMQSMLSQEQERKDEGSTAKDRMADNDEFAKLRNILTTAKSEVENLQTSKASGGKYESKTEQDSYLSETYKTRLAVKEIQDKYDTDDREYPTTSSARENQQFTDRMEQPWSRYKAKRKYLQEEKPLAESTPNSSLIKSSTDSSSLLVQQSNQDSKYEQRDLDAYQMAQQSDHYRSTRNVIKPTPKISRFINSSADGRYDRSNLRLGNSCIDVNMTNSHTRTPNSLLQESTASIMSRIRSASSKTKEVIELKHKNSAELDLTKSFRPIDPDAETKDTDTKFENFSLPNKLSYASAYQSKYNSSSYKSTARYRMKPTTYGLPNYRPTKNYVGKSERFHSQKDSSVDSAYSSPSQSLSTKPDVSPLKSINDFMTTRNKYNQRPTRVDTITKLVDHENVKTRRLNDTIDEVESHVGKVSLIQNAGRPRQFSNFRSYTARLF